MQLMLYDKRQTDFSMNGDPIHHVYDAHVIRDEGFYLKFKLLLDKNKDYQKIKEEMIIGAKTPDGINQFRVFDITPKTDHVEIVALHLFYFLDFRKIKSFSLNKATGKEAILVFKNNFVSNITPYTFDSSVIEEHDFTTDTQSTNDGYYNALEIINRIGKRWDSEFLLNGFDVRMIKRLGKKTNALLSEKKNISEFESKETISGLVTRIHAHSTWTLDREDEGYVEDGNNERSLNVVVDSPLINEYSQIYEEEFTNNDLRTKGELINWAKLKYSTDHIDKPKRSIELKTNIIDGTEINYGDDLVLKYLIHDIDEVIRCVGYDYDPVGEEYYSVELGDWRQNFGSAINNSVADVSEKQKSQLERLSKEVQIVQMAANGINRVASGPNPVPNPITGDIWLYYELDRPSEVEMRIFNSENGLWERQDITSEEVELKFQQLDQQSKKFNDQLQKAKQDLINIELTPGDSAYEIAVKHGFQGSEEEWLESLEGRDGVKGPPGKNGQPTYTWIKYADTPTRGMSDYPKASTQYIGIAENKDTPTQSSNYSDYKWSKIKGEDGQKGSDGQDGAPGKDGLGVARTDIKYTKSTSGTRKPSTGWSNNIPTVPPGQYLWTKTTWTYTNNSTESAYSVSRIGQDGNTGSDGIPGKDGVGVSSTVIEYATSTSGTTKPTKGYSKNIPTAKQGDYIWTRTTWNYTDGTVEHGYSVARIGTDGREGVDGQTLYTWIKYADTASGKGMSDDPTGKKFIGIAYNKTTSTKSGNPSDYAWSAMYDLKALEDIELKLKGLSDQAEILVDISGNDQEMIFSDNRLDTDINGDDWAFLLEDRTKEITHNGSGFDVTQDYHFRTIAKYVPRVSSQVRVEFEVIE